MRKELYDSLSEKERAMYDELAAFSKRLSERIEEVIRLLERVVEMGNGG